MSDTLTFISKTKKGTSYTFTAKAEYAEKFPEYKSKMAHEQLIEGRITQYLHNPNGPAVTRNSDGYSEYFLDGHLLQGEQLVRFKSNLEFGEQLEEMINE